MSELYELPNGWEWKTLLDVCTFINGRAYKKDELLSSGKYPVLRVGNFFTNNNWYYSDLELPNNKYCDYGDLLYAWSASFGPQIWKGNKSIYHYHIWKLIPNKELITKEFLYQMLDWDVDKIKADQGTGATMIHITKGSIESRIVPIPPLSEQQRIVSKLDLLFEKIDKSIALHQKNMDEANAFVGSVLNDVFGELEEKYEKYSLDSISDLIDGDRGSNYPKKTEFFDNEYCLFLNAKNVTKFGFKFDEKQFITKGKDELLRKGKLKKEDVIITTRGTIGNVSIYDDSIPYVNVRINSGMAIIRIKDMKKLYNRFIYKYLYSPQFLDYLNDVQSGSAQPQITIKNLKESFFSIPPLNIQQKVVKYLDEISEKIEKIKQAQKTKMNSLKALKASILDQAFKGEL